jgi:hypothetical protein
LRGKSNNKIIWCPPHPILSNISCYNSIYNIKCPRVII